MSIVIAGWAVGHVSESCVCGPLSPLTELYINPASNEKKNKSTYISLSQLSPCSVLPQLSAQIHLCAAAAPPFPFPFFFFFFQVRRWRRRRSRHGAARRGGAVLHVAAGVHAQHHLLAAATPPLPFPFFRACHGGGGRRRRWRDCTIGIKWSPSSKHRSCTRRRLVERLVGMDLSSSLAASAASPSLAKAVDTYRKAVGTAATLTAYTVLARGMARELVPHDLRAAVAWAASLVRGRFEPRPAERRTAIIRRRDGGDDDPYGRGHENRVFADAHSYLATKIDPRSMARFCLSGGDGWRPAPSSVVISMVPGDSMTDVFEGVEFTWTSVSGEGGGGGTAAESDSLELSFDAEHTGMALDRYVPFIRDEVERARRRDRELGISMNEGSSWNGIVHHHPATFDTVAMDPALKKSVVDDLDRFMRRKEYYRRIGKAWKRGYLLYGPPGTGKSSLVAAMANYLRFDLYDLDLSQVYSNYCLQRLLFDMPNRSLLVVEDIDCCFSARSREDAKNSADDDDEDKEKEKLTLSGLLNLIDGLWSTSGEERVIVFTTNYRDRLDPALLRPGRMDMHVYMGHCGWDAFTTLARNYFLVDDHPLFPEIRRLISQAEVTPAEVSEMLLRSEDAGTALAGLVEFLEVKKKEKMKMNQAAV